nr:SAHS [Hypsibius exemplaris]
MKTESHLVVLSLYFHYDDSRPAQNVTQNIAFQMGITAELNRGPNRMVMRYTEDDGKLIGDGEIPAKNQHIHLVFEAHGDQLIKVKHVNRHKFVVLFAKLSKTVGCFADVQRGGCCGEKILPQVYQK